MIPGFHTRFRRPEPILTLAVAAYLIAPVLSNFASAEELQFHGPLLQWHRDPTQSVTFSWVEESQAESVTPVWRTGIAGFGYGDDDDQTELLDMEDRYERVYLARRFELESIPQNGGLKLIVDYDDAFVAWINGVEVARSKNIEGHHTEAEVDDTHEAGKPEVFTIGNLESFLKDGANLLTLEGHNVDDSSSDFTLDPVLIHGDTIVIPAGAEWTYLAGSDPGAGWFTEMPGLSSKLVGGSGWELGVRLRGSDEPLALASVEESRFGETDYPLFHAAIDQLLPGSEYEYVLSTGQTVVKNGWFRTAPDQLLEPISFVVGGDMDTAPSIPVSKLAGEEDPLFALVGGDLAYANGKETTRWFHWLDNWTEYVVGKDGRDIPIIAIVGNHETKGLWIGPSRAPFYSSLFDLPSGRTNFTVDFGGYMSIVLLDSNHTQKVKHQTAWLDQELADRKEVPNVFAIYHRPAWGTGVKRNMSDIQKEWCPLFEKHAVDCVFENDHHTYKRTHKIVNGLPDPERGVLYIGDGGWGRELRPISDSHLDRVGARNYLAHWASRHHLVRVTISPGGTKTYEAKSPGIGVFDSFIDEDGSPAE